MWWVWSLLAYAADFEGLKLSTWRVGNMSLRVWRLCVSQTSRGAANRTGETEEASLPCWHSTKHKIHSDSHCKHLFKQTADLSSESLQNLLMMLLTAKHFDALLAHLLIYQKSVWTVRGGQCDDAVWASLVSRKQRNAGWDRFEVFLPAFMAEFVLVSLHAKDCQRETCNRKPFL